MQKRNVLSLIANRPTARADGGTGGEFAAPTDHRPRPFSMSKLNPSGYNGPTRVIRSSRSPIGG